MEYKVVEADLERDREALLSFWRENLPQWPEKKYDWFYRNNPLQPAVCCALRESADDTYVGLAAVFPRRFVVDGQVCTGGISGDLAVRKSHRVLGPALTLQRTIVATCEKRAIDFIYGFPNERAEPVQKRVGYRVIGTSRRMVRILRSYNKVKERIRIPLLSRPVAALVDLFMRITSPESRRHRLRDFSVETPSSFDRRFDVLWEKVSKQYPVLGDRSQSGLNWRFSQCPYRDYRIFALTRKDDNELAGYIVYDTREGTARIADLLADNTDNTLPLLLTAFIRRMRRERLDRITVNYFGSPSLMRQLRRFRFSDRGSGGKVVLFTEPDFPHAATLYDQSNWYLLDGDNDV
jgi:hypothetical protein